MSRLVAERASLQDGLYGWWHAAPTLESLTKTRQAKELIFE